MDLPHHLLRVAGYQGDPWPAAVLPAIEGSADRQRVGDANWGQHRQVAAVVIVDAIADPAARHQHPFVHALIDGQVGVPLADLAAPLRALVAGAVVGGGDGRPVAEPVAGLDGRRHLDLQVDVQAVVRLDRGPREDQLVLPAADLGPALVFRPPVHQREYVRHGVGQGHLPAVRVVLAAIAGLYLEHKVGARRRIAGPRVLLHPQVGGIGDHVAFKARLPLAPVALVEEVAGGDLDGVGDRLGDGGRDPDKDQEVDPVTRL